MKTLQKYVAVAALTVVCLFAPGFACSSFDRKSFQSLSASKAVIDQAGYDYNAHTIAQTTQTKNLIEQARNAQDTAKDAFASYYAIESNGTTGQPLVDAQVKLAAALLPLTQLALDIQKIDAAANKLPKPQAVSAPSK